MKKIFTFIITAVLALSTASSIQASPAYPYPIKYTQPDGSVITIQIHGDEFLHWTTCGNSLVAQDSEGYWRYATFNSDGTSNAQGSRVSVNLSGDGSAVTPPAAAIAAAKQMRESLMPVKASISPASSESVPAISNGEKHFLILLIEFTDREFKTPKEDFEAMLNGENYTYNGAVGSVKKYYTDVSCGKFIPSFDVYGPIQVPYSSAQCSTGTNDYKAVKAACEYADKNYDIDFSKYCNASTSLVDNVFFFFPGYNQAEGGGSDCIWPHAVTYFIPFLTLDGKGINHYGCTSEYKSNTGSTRAGIGTFCHEFGHVIGLPDFYDTDYDETNGEGDGLFHYSLMSSGNYNNEGRTPPNMTTIERNILGWKTEIPLLKDGNYTLKGVQDNEGYMTETYNSNEYFIFEARNKTGWDAYISASGLLIYHVDQSMNWSNINEYHPAVYFKAAYPSSLNPPHASEANVPYPGPYNITSFDNNSPSPATDWSGKWHGDEISNIKYDSSKHQVTFTYTKKDPNAKTLSGKVTDYTTGAAISGASIKVDYEGGSKSTTTSSDGSYTMDLTSSSYNNFIISISKTGYYSLENESYTHPGGNVIKDFNLASESAAEDGIDLRRCSENPTNRTNYASNSKDTQGAIKFSASEMAPFVGMKITDISFRYNTSSPTEVKAIVYFDEERVLNQTVGSPKSGVFNDVKVSEEIIIPSGKNVYVGYSIKGAGDYPYSVDKDKTENNGFYEAEIGSTSWHNYSQYGSLLISFKVVAEQSSPDEKDEMYTLGYSGLNLEPGKTYTRPSSYLSSATKIDLSMAESSDPIKSVTYYFDDTKQSGDSISIGYNTTKGDHTIRAEVTYQSGRTETIIQVIKVQ